VISRGDPSHDPFMAGAPDGRKISPVPSTGN